MKVRNDKPAGTISGETWCHTFTLRQNGNLQNCATEVLASGCKSTAKLKLDIYIFAILRVQWGQFKGEQLTKQTKNPKHLKNNFIKQITFIIFFNLCLYSLLLPGAIIIKN